MNKILSIIVVLVIFVTSQTSAVPLDLLNVLPAIYAEFDDLHANANDQVNNLAATSMPTIFNSTDSTNILNHLLTIVENEKNNFHQESMNLHQVYLKGLKDNPSVRLNNSLVKLSQKLLTKTNNAINTISMIYNQESNDLNDLITVLHQSFDKVKITKNDYISMPKTMQQKYISTIGEILGSIKETGESIEALKADVKSIETDLQPALKSSAIPTKNFMLDAIFSAIVGVLNQIVKSYSTIETNVEIIGNSFVDLNNIVQNNGKDGTTILIPKDKFAHALGQAIGGVMSAYNGIGNNELELVSQIAYLDGFVQKVFQGE